MKITKLFASLILAVAAAIGFASCDTNSSADYVTTQELPGFLNFITDNNTMVTTVHTGVSYNLEFNYSDNTCNIKITGLRLPNQSFPVLQFSKVPWKYNSRGWKEIKMVDATPSAGNFANVPVFTEFRLEMLDYTIQQVYSPVVDLTYTINNNHSVQSVSSLAIVTGETKVKSPDGTEYSPADDDEPVYLITLDATNGTTVDTNLNTFFKKGDNQNLKANINISGARINNTVAAANVRIKNVPFTVKNGAIYLAYDQDAYTPATPLYPVTIDGSNTETTKNDCPITDLRGTLDINRGLSLTFDCKYKETVYDVDIKTEYPEVKEEK